MEDPQYHGQRWRSYSQGLPDRQGALRGWIQASMALSPIEDALSKLLWNMLVSIPALLLAGVGGMFLADRALKPIDRVSSTAEQIGTDDLSRRIGYVGPNDEVGRLAAAFDHMLGRIERAFALERRFTADASHELRTPLAAIKGRIGVALSRPREAGEYQATLHNIESEADRLIRLSNDLLLLARLDQGTPAQPPEDIALHDLLESVADQMAPMAAAARVRIVLNVEPGLHIRGSIDQMIRVFLNIVDNAVKYSPDRGLVEINGRRAGSAVHIDIVDQGPGIAAGALPRLTERFFRVEEGRSRSHGGAGLGLSIANEIVLRHGGRLAFASREGGGTCVSLMFE
jgi:signal transduction histidine kinase